MYDPLAPIPSAFQALYDGLPDERVHFVEGVRHCTRSGWLSTYE